MQWFARPLTREEMAAFLNHAQRGELLSIFAHANYLINLAATNRQFHANSLRSLSEELTRADQLELPFLVLHPGAHLGAGESAVRKMFAQFDRTIGLDRLVAIHLNDSKTARGSRVDRHEHIGKGKIGLAAFRFIMRDHRFRKIPKVLETPKAKDLREDVVNLKTLRGLIGR